MFRKIKNIISRKRGYDTLKSNDFDKILIVDTDYNVTERIVEGEFAKVFFDHFKDLAVEYKMVKRDQEIKMHLKTYKQCCEIIHEIQKVNRELIAHDIIFLNYKLTQFKAMYNFQLKYNSKNTICVTNILDLMKAYYHMFIINNELKTRCSL